MNWRSGFLFVLAIILVPLVSLDADEGISPQKPTDPQIAVRKAAETAEVHGVGVNRPLAVVLSSRDIKDMRKFAEAIQSREGLGGRIYDLLDEDTQKLLNKQGVIANIGKKNIPEIDRDEAVDLTGWIKSRLREMLERSDFYTPEAVKGTTLSKEVTDGVALGDKRTYFQTVLMNRRLLSDAFPNVFSPPPEGYLTVRVEVHEGKPVVLVLSSYEMCRWEVTLRKGAKVTGVILAGYHSQEVAGLNDVPQVYAAFYGPDGKRRRGGAPVFHGYNENDASFKKVVARVKELTGKEFAHFQGENTPGPEREPYIVRPTANP